MVVICAGENVRARYPHFSEPRPVRPPPDGGDDRLYPRLPRRLEGSLEDFGAFIEFLPHVEVLLLESEFDLAEGELEIGQISGAVREILPAGEIVRRMVAEYEAVRGNLPPLDPPGETGIK